MNILPVSFKGTPNKKLAQKMIDNLSEYAKGYNMATSKKLSQDEIKIHALNASLSGNKSFLNGLKDGLQKLFGKK